ncbi:MAG: hypothetical protein RSD97_10440 [Lachnospiraceae bacterium]
MQDMLKRVREEQIKCVIVKDFREFSVTILNRYFLSRV